MLYFKLALLRTLALGQFAALIARDIIPVVLLCMARIAEVGVSPTEPLGDVAAKLAFEFYIISAMRLAILYSCTNALGGALTTN